MNAAHPNAELDDAWQAYDRGRRPEVRAALPQLLASESAAIRDSARLLQLYLAVERSVAPGTGGRAEALARRCLEAGDVDSAARGFLLAADQSHGRRRAELLAQARASASGGRPAQRVAVAQALARDAVAAKRHAVAEEILQSVQSELVHVSPTAAAAHRSLHAELRKHLPSGRVSPEEAQPRLVAVSLALAQQRDAQVVCDMVARAVHDVLDVDRACVVLADERGSRVVAQHPEGGAALSEPALRRCLAGEEVFVEDISRDISSATRSILGMGVTSVLCVPMMHGSEVVGAIYADAVDVAAIALGERKWALRTLAAAAAVAVGNAKALEEQIERVRRHRELAHDLRNVLAAATGAAELLREMDPRDDQREMLDIVVRTTRALTVQVTEALAPHPPEPVPVDLAATARQAVAMLSLDASAEGKRFELKVPDDPCWVRGREQELLRAAINLMTNALKYGPRGEAVDIWVDRSGTQVVFSVRDRGPGVPEEDLPRVFESGFQATGALHGHGLGLGFVKRVIEEGGGRIGIKNDPGGGARVLFALPELHDSGA
ncbi:MAG: GAF domain-containing sensor histidine kinase [Deltaproteobacteria bacterium]|nr:MAG: GAF domain-containing sensor histidine kinase [Deltaproteobacteria bacterium]